MIFANHFETAPCSTLFCHCLHFQFQRHIFCRDCFVLLLRNRLQGTALGIHAIEPGAFRVCILIIAQVVQQDGASVLHFVDAGGTVAIQVGLCVENIISPTDAYLFTAFQNFDLPVFNGQNALPGTLGQEQLLNYFIIERGFLQA